MKNQSVTPKPAANQSKAKRIRFTKMAIESLENPAKGRSYVYDTKTLGLVLSVAELVRKRFSSIEKSSLDRKDCASASSQNGRSNRRENVPPNSTAK